MKTSTTTDGQPTVTWVLESKFKELTDEEIKQVTKDLDIWCEVLDCMPPSYTWKFHEKNLLDFARAILRKASEK